MKSSSTKLALTIFLSFSASLAKAEAIFCRGSAPAFAYNGKAFKNLNSKSNSFLLSEGDALALMIGPRPEKPLLVVEPWGEIAAKKIKKNIPKDVIVDFKSERAGRFHAVVGVARTKAILSLDCKTVL